MKVYVRGGRAELVCPSAAAGPGHLTAQFLWQDGSEHVEHHAVELTCTCGQLLVHAAGTDPWTHPFVEVEGTPHGA